MSSSDPTAPDPIADYLFGQADLASFGDTTIVNEGTLLNPTDVAIDSRGRLFIADGSHNRILVVGDGVEQVNGQDSDTASSRNKGTTPTAGSLYYPVRLAVDPMDRLYVTDYGNNRVLRVQTP